MLDRLAEIETKYEDLAEQINDPDVIANQTEWRKRMKEYSDMTPIVEKYREYKQAKEGIRKRRASCAACAGDGKRRARAYLNGDGGSAAGGGGGRCAY